jgi:lactoylglutathione lyase
MARRKTVRRKTAAAASRTRKAKSSARKRSKAPKDRRVNERETLRLRAIEPAFTVDNLARSVDFYTKVLGFVVDERFTAPDGAVMGVMLKAGVCRLALSQDDWAKGRDRQKGVGTRVWCTTVQNLDTLAARIKAAGHKLVEEPKDQPWGGRTMLVDDPDGFHLTIYRRG